MKKLATAQGTKLSVKQFSLISEAAERGFALNAVSSLRSLSYRVLEIPSHADIEIEAKIQYVPDGIIEDEINKAMLYGAKTIKYLRKRLLQYEILKKNANGKSNNKFIRDDKGKKQNDKLNKQDMTKFKRCFNCGNKERLSIDCPDKAKGSKCFKCNEYGHIASKCTNNGKSTQNVKVCCDTLNVGDKRIYKIVEVLGKKMTGINDTRSDLNLIRASAYIQLGMPTIKRQECYIFGAAK
ncbi:hypothetical protein PV326_014024 [Microctonus aethiopoides]|nr:hypothetical protein PV326_014024 [Microctonus aethiopoides]